MVKELARIRGLCFNSDLPLPQVSVKRMKFSKCLQGGYFGADYKPPNHRRPALIGVYPILLLKKEDVIIALAHELVHHWEYMTPLPINSRQYPLEMDSLIQFRFPCSPREENWRRSHSPYFLSKSWEVAQQLGIPIRDFLFKGAQSEHRPQEFFSKNSLIAAQ